MLQTRVIKPAANAYQYPLLIKRLLLSGVRYERSREIVYRDQLREVDRDVTRGVLTQTEAERLRTEIGRKILDADRAMARQAWRRARQCVRRQHPARSRASRAALQCHLRHQRCAGAGVAEPVVAGLAAVALRGGDRLRPGAAGNRVAFRHHTPSCDAAVHL